jgi:hypothetical protein
MIPELWKAYDEAGTANEQLAVWGIWISPATGSADYQVGRSFESNDPDTLPELPDGHAIMVNRDSTGRLLNRD